jgi:hypothetical protein
MNYEKKFIRGLKKEFENIYDAPRFLKSCKIEKVGNDIGIDEMEYREMMSSMFRKYQKDNFDFLVKYYWLSQKFTYGGVLRSQFRHNGWVLDSAFGIYMRKWVGFNNRIVTQAAYTKLNGYIDDFFPNLLAENPFKKKMKYPYKYMTFEHLLMVTDMPERIELLNYCEKKKMSFANFVDYVCNYVLMVNQKTGQNIFSLDHAYFSHNPHVKYNLKYEYAGQSKKIETSDICTGLQQLSQPESIPTEFTSEGHGNNSEPTGTQKVSGV